MSSIEAGRCEVWTMDEYGAAEAWVKHYEFSQFSCIVPIGFTLHSEFLFIQVGAGLALYDPIAANIKLINTMATQNGWIKIIEYVDSLVWIVPPKCEINSSNISHFENLER
ncbi:unnamed protein product [Lactuca virosa]|uniref:F-box associated domain-containing protein n=1 Tax=Lactuca virosa TaxID=75947 RepID=A0AAU9MB44_9ASTR|nr:unnamed protein product [Lactuca virosa]